MITQDMRAAYDRDGVVMIPGILKREEVDEVTAYFEDLYREFYRPHGRGPEMIGEAARVYRYDGGIFFDFLCRDIPEFLNFVERSRLSTILMDLLDLESITLWRDEFHCKHHTGDQTDSPWHQDVANLPFSGTQFPGVWIPLIDISEDTSPLCTIPGSHLDRSVVERPWKSEDKDRLKGELAKGYVPSKDYDQMVAHGDVGCQKWLLKAGDALVLHPYVVHGAPRNTSKSKRVSYVTRWLGDDARWNPDKHSIVDPQADIVFVDQRPAPGRLRKFLRSYN